MLSTQFSIEELEQNVLMARPNANYNEKIWAHSADIKKVVFEPFLKKKENERYVYNISQDDNNSRVMGRLVPDTTDVSKYILYIQAEKKIYANENSSFLFFNFTNLEIIDGMQYFDTSNVTMMKGMFYNCSSLTSLDVSNFDTNKVTNMSSMFNSCSSLTALDLSSFNTSNVTNMASMFAKSSNLTELNVSGLDTSNVTDMNCMFQNLRLTSLNLSNFDTSKVTNMRAMFWDCSNLTTLDVSSFDTSNVRSMYAMFIDCNNLTSLNLSNFDTSNVTDVQSMFVRCYSLTTTITIRGTLCNNYIYMFVDAATNTGASITVNYTADASALVDNMIATKSNNSNVKKGVQVA